MVKNKGKGGKNRRRGKADGDMKRELTFKEDGQGRLLLLPSLYTHVKPHTHEKVKRSTHGVPRALARQNTHRSHGCLAMGGWRRFALMV